MPVIPKHDDLESFLKARIEELTFLKGNLFVEAAKQFYDGKLEAYTEILTGLREGHIKVKR